jgi:hypothetical protein
MEFLRLGPSENDDNISYRGESTLEMIHDPEDSPGRSFWHHQQDTQRATIHFLQSIITAPKDLQ